MKIIEPQKGSNKIYELDMTLEKLKEISAERLIACTLTTLGAVPLQDTYETPEEALKKGAEYALWNGKVMDMATKKAI